MQRHDGWVLCPMEDDFVELEHIGFEVGEKRIIWSHGMDFHAFHVLGGDDALRQLKSLWGRFYWSFTDERGNKYAGFKTEKLRRAGKGGRGSVQSSLFPAGEDI